MRLQKNRSALRGLPGYLVSSPRSALRGLPGVVVLFSGQPYGAYPVLFCTPVGLTGLSRFLFCSSGRPYGA